MATWKGGGGIFGFSICPAQHGSISGGWDLVQSSGHLLPYIINSLKIWSHGMVDCCAIIRVFKVFKIFQFKNIPKSENHWSQLFKKNLSELLVFMEEPMKNQWFYCRLFDFLKKFWQPWLHTYLCFYKKITVMNLKNCPNDNRGGLFQRRCPDIGFFQYQVGLVLAKFWNLTYM